MSLSLLIQCSVVFGENWATVGGGKMSIQPFRFPDTMFLSVCLHLTLKKKEGKRKEVKKGKPPDLWLASRLIHAVTLRECSRVCHFLLSHQMCTPAYTSVSSHQVTSFDGPRTAALSQKPTGKGLEFCLFLRDRATCQGRHGNHQLGEALK